ncbi:MAG: DUF389 domain-containing protein [Ruminiclostridium sp.]|nr:DUF389 domain-containing protein [Ruminiclostridium sp.]
MSSEKVNSKKQEIREEIEKHRGQREELRSEIREELMRSEEVRKEVKKISGFRRYAKKLLDMRGDMMSYDEISRMMDENTEIHGSNMWILMLAIFIASIGLNVNSTAVIIGAMLVSPLMSGIMSMGYSLAVRDLQLLEKAAVRFATQVAISLITSTIYFMISPLSEPTSEMIARTSPTIWDVLIALFGGIAGMIGNTRKVKGNVVPGVAIATALMPPLCTVGYGIARLDIRFILGAGYLFLINTLFIALSCALVTVLMRVPHVRKLSPERQKYVNIWVGVITVIAIVPSVYIGANTVFSSVINTSIDSYIANEFRFSDSQVVQTSTDSESKIINVSVIGEHLPDETISVLQGQLANYGLSDYTLRVTQNMIPDFTQTDDTERITIAVQESKINELNAQISQKDADYAELRTELEKMRQDVKNVNDFTGVAKKASEIFTELENCACGYMSSGGDYYVVLAAETEYPLEPDREQTIRNWLMTEAESDRYELIINARNRSGQETGDPPETESAEENTENAG